MGDCRDHWATPEEVVDFLRSVATVLNSAVGEGLNVDPRSCAEFAVGFEESAKTVRLMARRLAAFELRSADLIDFARAGGPRVLRGSGVVVPFPGGSRVAARPFDDGGDAA